MKPDLCFRVSVIDAGIQVLRHLQQYPNVTIKDAVRQLRSGSALRSSLDYEFAETLLQEHGVSLFHPYDDRSHEFRETLFAMAVRLRPFWAKISPLGRDRVNAILSTDQRQCLRYAKLLDSYEETVRAWWDRLAAHFRALEDDRRLEVGRVGEELSMLLEIQRLETERIPRSPKWLSIDDNLAGFDILSFMKTKDGSIVPMHIEVKATSAKEDKVFYLSRREWEFATRNLESHRFHFWILETNQVWVASVGELEPNISVDRGIGTWQRIKLDLRSQVFSSPNCDHGVNMSVLVQGC